MNDPNMNFQKVTRRTVDILHLFVVLLMPVIWLGDYKNMISLMFKKIYSQEPYSVAISQSLYIFIIVLGLLGYILHRRYRLKEHGYRFEALKRENSFVDTYDHQELKIKLLKKIHALVEMRNAEWELTHEIYEYKTPIDSSIGVQSKSGKKICDDDGNGDGHTTDASKGNSHKTTIINTNSPVAKQKRQETFRKSFSDAEACTYRRQQV